jgi:hypothetical protein
MERRRKMGRPAGQTEWINEGLFELFKLKFEKLDNNIIFE